MYHIVAKHKHWWERASALFLFASPPLPLVCVGCPSPGVFGSALHEAWPATVDDRPMIQVGRPRLLGLVRRRRRATSPRSKPLCL